MPLALIPVTLGEANAFVQRRHRHHPPVAFHKFSLGAISGDCVVGVAIIGRPVSLMRDDGCTLEVLRLCADGAHNACSFLYGAAARAAFALGYRRIGTYTLPDEGGTSLRATGWKLIGERGGKPWSTPQHAQDRQISDANQMVVGNLARVTARDGSVASGSYRKVDALADHNALIGIGPTAGTSPTQRCDAELPSICPQRVSQDGQKPCSDSTSSRRAKSSKRLVISCKQSFSATYEFGPNRVLLSIRQYL